MATLGDLVEDFVRMGLGYGDKEFIVSNEVGILYDIDETENVGKKLTDLGTFPPLPHHIPFVMLQMLTLKNRRT